MFYRHCVLKPCLPLNHLHSPKPLFSPSHQLLTSMESSRKYSSDVQSFTEYLQRSTRIVALLGAGISAASGLPTFRGAGGIWRNNQAVSLATPGAFDRDPGLVWHFYSYRRHMALNAKPNPAHYALAKLAMKNPHFITISQNVDGKNGLSYVVPVLNRS